MVQKLRTSIATLVAGFALAVIPMAVAMPATVSAQADIQNSLGCGSNLDVNTDCESEVSSGTEGINTIVETIINVFSIIVGVVSVIMIIYGGFRYITSGGDSGNVSGAKNTIIYAVIGLVVVALAQFIVQFVLDRVTSAV